MPRKPLGDRPLTNAEVQARWRARKAAEAEAMQAEIRRLSDELRQRKVKRHPTDQAARGGVGGTTSG